MSCSSLVPSPIALLFALGLLTSPARLGAQGPPREISVGDPSVHLALIGPETRQFRIVTIRDGGAGAASTLSESLTPGKDRGRPAVLKITTETDASGSFTDTLVMDPVTLAPLRYVSHDAKRSRTLWFTGRRVTGEVRTTAGEVSPVDVALERPVFFGGAFYTVLRSLPINDSTDVIVPFFRAYDLRTIAVRYRTLGSETVDSAGTLLWRVLAQVGEGFSIYWMDQQTHELRRVVNFAPGGGESHLIPVPAAAR